MKQLVKHNGYENWKVMREQAEMLVKSRFLPKDVDTPEKAIAIMLKGQELGIGPMEAFSGINVIQGKPTVSPALMLALINRSGQLQNISIDDNGTTCTVIMTRLGRKPHREDFSMQDAHTMGLGDRDNWKKQPKTMRKWRAISACARVVFPDVIEGMYLPEEMGAEVNDDGEIVQVETVEPAPAKPAIPTEQELTQRIEEKAPELALPDPATAPTAHLPPSPLQPKSNGSGDKPKNARPRVITGFYATQIMSEAAEKGWALDEKTGKVVGQHLLNAIRAGGFMDEEITDQNWNEARDAMRRHYALKQAA